MLKASACDGRAVIPQQPATKTTKLNMKVKPYENSGYADLINTTLMTSTVPSQWKAARIRPVPKTSTPHQAVECRLPAHLHHAGAHSHH